MDPRSGPSGATPEWVRADPGSPEPPDSQVLHDLDVEASVRIFRWAAVVFAVLQIGVLYQPTPGIEVPFARLPVAGAFAAVLIAANLVSRWAAASADPVRMRRAGLVQLGVDTFVAFAVVGVFAFDPEIRLWPLFVLPVLEGAMRFQLPGAIGAAVASTGLGALVTARWPGITTPEIVSSVAFQFGVLITVAIGSGGLARRLEQARGVAEARADRLRELAEHAPGVATHRHLADAADALLAATEAVLGASRAELYLKEHRGWRRIGALGADDAAEDDLVDEVLDRSLHGEDTSTDGRSLVLEPIRDDRRIIGALVVRLAEDADDAVDRGLVRLLAAQAAASLDNARLAETEARTIAELRALDEMKDEFVHILGHELRGPLNHIGQYAFILRERPDQLTAEQRERFLRGLEDTTSRLSRLVADVQEVTQAELGELPVAVVPVDLGPIVHEIVSQEVDPSPDHRSELDIAPDLPPASGDPDRVRQVLRNLVNNAVKYSPDGGRIHIAVHHDEETVTVEVTDDGVGVPAHLHSHLFEKFVRIPSATYTKGTGLGLYLTRRLVEAMGGTIRLESVAGRGSTFAFTLPIADPSAGSDVHDVAGADRHGSFAGPHD